jgi:fructokinase
LTRQGIVSFGEVFIDFIADDSTNTTYSKFLGGATVNVAAGIARLGVPSYYLCKLGADELSQFADQELRKEKVNINDCVRANDKQICVVYVHLNDEGERGFHSYVNPTPGVLLTAEELNKELIQQTKIFYFGSGTLFHDKAKTATEQGIFYAKEGGALVGFDPNIRLKRWESEEHCRQTVWKFLQHAHIVKMAEEELLFLTECNVMEEGLRKMASLKIPYLFITKGSEGALAIQEGKKVEAPGVKVDVVDTTGAGDAFMAGVLKCFYEKGCPGNPKVLREYVEYANKLGALATTEVGALTALGGGEG